MFVTFYIILINNIPYYSSFSCIKQLIISLLFAHVFTKNGFTFYETQDITDRYNARLDQISAKQL